jgi:YD repeat-containing protein
MSKRCAQGYREGIFAEKRRSSLTCRRSDLIRSTAVLALTSATSFLCLPACDAQVSTTYSYNSSNQVIQALSSAGVGVQYQYDAAGNTVAVTAISATALAQGTPDTVTFLTPGESTLLSLSITAGQPVVLTESSLMTTPSNSPLTVNIYNSAGSLVGSFNTAASSSIDLSNLPAGTYSVVVIPSSGVTGSLTLALNSEPAGGESGATDGPLPIWALVVLGAGLVGIGYRNEKRLRRVA